MRSHRDEFPKSVKAEALARCGGICECGCGLAIQGTPHYDHYPVPAAIGGTGTLDNCRVLDPKCHKRITDTKDIPAIAKTNRIREKRLGFRETKRGFRGWRKMDGTPVWRNR